MTGLGGALAALTLAGCAYQLLTALTTRRPRAAPALTEYPPVTILKPLHGAEPRLRENLTTYLAQDYPAAVQVVCGVQDPYDPALLAIAGMAVSVVCDASRHGSNAKVSNLINMMAAAQHDVLVLSDSDIVVPSNYLRQVVAALAQPGVGAVTCFYRGRGDGNEWSRFAAYGIDTGYLPSGLFASRLGLAQPCMGSTIALTRETLAQIGGFDAVADVLADDYALGEAVRSLGLRVAVAPPIVIHAGTERGPRALIAHELRWNVTIFRLSPWGFAGLGLLSPIPISVLAWACGFPLVFLPAIFARAVVALRIRSLFRYAPVSIRWLPHRDLLSFVLFVATFFRQSVDWRGRTLGVTRSGRITNEGK